MSKPQALIIEDNPDLATIFSAALEAAGCDTHEIYDGQEAMDYLKSARPQIIILDLHLPHISGQAILQRIRGDSAFASTRVVIATADPQMADMLQDESDLVLLKPVSFTQLRDLAGRLAANPI
jgi:CheY-like chemotaxis protein